MKIILTGLPYSGLKLLSSILRTHPKIKNVSTGFEYMEAIESVSYLGTNFRVILCIRDPRDIWATSEKHWRECPNTMSVQERFDNLFIYKNVNLYDRLMELIHIFDIGKRVYIFRFEDFLKDKQKSMDLLLQWIGVEKLTYTESVSYYPKTIGELKIPVHQSNALFVKYQDFYQAFYSDFLNDKLKNDLTNSVQYNNIMPVADVEAKIREAIHRALQEPVSTANKAFESFIY